MNGWNAAGLAPLVPNQQLREKITTRPAQLPDQPVALPQKMMHGWSEKPPVPNRAQVQSMFTPAQKLLLQGPPRQSREDVAEARRLLTNVYDKEEVKAIKSSKAVGFEPRSPARNHRSSALLTVTSKTALFAATLISTCHQRTTTQLQCTSLPMWIQLKTIQKKQPVRL